MDPSLSNRTRLVLINDIKQEYRMITILWLQVAMYNAMLYIM